MTRKKYPRTPHIPGSNPASDDLRWPDCKPFEGHQVVVSEKIDGESTSIYSDGFCHARSTNSLHHPSRSWVKALAAQIGPLLPAGWRLVGENLFAMHSILYTELPSYFFAFALIDEHDTFRAWDELADWCAYAEIPTVPELWHGVWDERVVRDRWTGQGIYPTFAARAPARRWPDDFESCEAEGYVIRLADAFAGEKFADSAAKFVRSSHVTTSSHWMTQVVVRNRLRGEI